MRQRKLEPDIRCPLDYGLSLLGGKWKARILCVLGTRGTMRYSSLRRELGNVTDAVLSAALRELAEQGLVDRQAFAEIPPRVEYGLTARGTSSLPVLLAIAQWAGAVPRENQDPQAPQCSRCDYDGVK